LVWEPQLRLFIGIELDDKVRDSAAAIAYSLERRLGRRIDARWVPSENLHITLSFIGNVPYERADAILRAVDRPFATGCFDLHIAGLGAFPAAGAPRVFWLGVRSGAESLAHLYAQLSARLQAMGFEPEHRPYSAHLTIARVREMRGRDYAGLRALLGGMSADAGTCRIQAVTVFRSLLSPKGATYEAVLRVPLQ
jgi:RNA 2',3'-cyclic 3'-phosphodiesterase